MKNKQKTNLFRFVSLRSPQTITQEREELGFIYPPSIFVLHSNSGVLKSGTGGYKLTNSDSLNRSRAITAIATFNSKSVVELKSSYSELWQFSTKLLGEQGRISRSMIEELTLPNGLTDPQLVDVWDNILEQALKPVNPNVRETCIQLLIANNFIAKFNNYSAATISNETEEEKEIRLEQELKDLNRLANAKIVLFKFFAKPKAEITAFTGNPSVSNNSGLLSRHKTKIAYLELQRLTALKDELSALNIQYQNEYQAELKLANESHETAVNSAISTFKSANPDLFNSNEIVDSKSVTTRSTTGSDTETAPDRSKTSSSSLDDSEEETINYISRDINDYDFIPEDVIPQFTFEFDNIFERQSISSQMGAELEDFVNANNMSQKDADSVLNEIERRIKSLKKVSRKVLRKKPSEILVNGVATQVLPTNDNDCVVSFNPILQSNGTYKNTLLLTIDTTFDFALFKRLELSLIIGDNELVLDDNDDEILTMVDNQEVSQRSTEAFNLISNNGEFITVEIFSETPFNEIQRGKTFYLVGTYTLSDGSRYSFSLESNTANTYSFTRAQLVSTAENSEDLLYGINKIGIADYRRVEQELYTYIPGEVSHIENVMAREYKERSTRNLTKTSDSLESSSENESESENESTENTSVSFSVEVANVIDQEKSSNLGFSASVNGKPSPTFGFNIGATGDFSTSLSRSNSNTDSLNKAKDITERALEKMKQKVSVSRKSKVVREVETKTNQGFDNREGDSHVTGVYRWIDKVFRNRIVNYGKRLVYEFMLPEPARFYKEAIIIKAEKEATTNYQRKGNRSTGGDLIKPDHPNSLKIEEKDGFYSFEDIDRHNYASLTAHYGVAVSTPKEDVILPFSKSHSFDKPGRKNTYNVDSPPRVEFDYGCHKLEGLLTHTGNGGRSKKVLFTVAGVVKEGGSASNNGVKTVINNQDFDNLVDGGIPISIDCENTKSVTISIKAHCRWKKDKYDEWRSEVFTKVMEAYETQLALYQEALQKQENESNEAANQAEAEKPKDQTLTTNSKFNETIIRTELKRLCIEMLIAPFDYVQGKDFYVKGKENIPNMKLNPDLDRYSSSVKFFEQAFDWEILAQKFYPYYWAQRANWKSLFQSQNGVDHVFQAFLQSGMGRVMVPVRKWFEDAVTYYMETGDIWNGSGMVIDSDDKLYLSLVDEAAVIEGFIEGSEWEIVVPTSLNILQNKSAIIDEGNLPLVMNDPDSLLIESTTALGDSSEG